jgi:predicted dehydrogenase
VNRLSKGPERYLDLRLTGENAVIDCSIGGDARLELGLRTRPARPFAVLHWSQGGTAVWREGNRERVLAREASNPFAAATAARLGELLAAIREGRPAERDGAHHRQTLAMVLAAYDSAESGRAVELAPYYDRS